MSHKKTNENSIKNLNENSNIINSVKGKIIINFDTEKELNIIYKAILPEIKTSPDYRSKANIKIENQTLIITINSEDMTSFRASTNSIIKWIKLSHNIIQLTNDEDSTKT
jgi:KEOPS complex subunit Pcc1